MLKHVCLVATYVLKNNIRVLFYISSINLGGDHVAIIYRYLSTYVETLH